MSWLEVDTDLIGDVVVLLSVCTLLNRQHACGNRREIGGQLGQLLGTLNNLELPVLPATNVIRETYHLLGREGVRGPCAIRRSKA